MEHVCGISSLCCMIPYKFKARQCQQRSIWHCQYMAYGMATAYIGTLAIVAVYNDGAYILIAFPDFDLQSKCKLGRNLLVCPCTWCVSRLHTWLYATCFEGVYSILRPRHPACMVHHACTLIWTGKTSQTKRHHIYIIHNGAMYSKPVQTKWYHNS